MKAKLTVLAVVVVVVTSAGCGGRTKTVIRTTTTQARQALMEDPLGKSSGQPSDFPFSVNSDLVATALRWERWGSDTASARGTFVFSPAPHTNSTSVTGTLSVSGLQACGATYYYTTVSFRFDSPPPYQPHVTLQAPCRSGTTTSSSTATTSSTTAQACGTVKDVGSTGANPADAVNLTARGTDCATARRVAVEWGRSAGAKSVLGYDCTFNTGSPASVSCVLGDNEIHFELR